MVTTITYKLGSFIKHIKATTENPRNFKAGEKYIVLSEEYPKVKTVTCDEHAGKLNNSIVNGDSIRRVHE